MRKILIYLLVILVHLGLFAWQQPVAAQDSSPLVLELAASGPVTPAMAEYLERGIRLAEQRGAELLVFELDTPGGSLDLMQKMVVSILESNVPVVVYVYPRGAIRRQQRGRRNELLPRARRHQVAPVRDPRPGGQHIYLSDVRSGRVWSATHHPTATDAKDDVVVFTMEKATFQRKDDEIGTKLDVAVSPEDDVEVRRLEVTNHGDRAREIEITSYAEIVLAPNADDLAHPAFGKLFLESEYVAESNALLCRRRPRSPDDAEVFAVHVIAQGRTQGPVEWVSDRARFLGRGRGPDDPQALDGRPLSGTTGVLVDPIKGTSYIKVYSGTLSGAFNVNWTVEGEPKP